jgi:glutamate-1-semialdehyde 2,1-aminomutase
LSTTSATKIDRARIAELTERETRRLNDATPGSARCYADARTVMPKGVPSSYQTRDPHPIYLSHGRGPQVWDVDGREYRDFHNGFGCMVQGHGHPAIAKAVADRYPLGSHFAAPTADAAIVARELARRFNLPKWRFLNSGSEATMDAIRLARAATGRDHIVKMEGSYHGHHDTVMVSIGVDVSGDIGPADHPKSVPYGAGIPQATVDMVHAVPFNNAAALDARLTELDGTVACVIMEAGMMNIGVVLPEPGYLEQVREITRRHNVILIFDEVKTGITIHEGGATGYYGVTPDIVTLAKAVGGGVPTAAIGGSEEVMQFVENGAVYQVGTFNGNPLSMAAAKANLLEVMTPNAYRHLDNLNTQLIQRCDEIIERYGLPAYTVGVGAKGCVTFSRTKVRNYREWAHGTDGELSDLAWLYNMNRGIFMTPGREEEWTLSITHGDDDVDRFTSSFEEFAHDVTRS